MPSIGTCSEISITRTNVARLRPKMADCCYWFLPKVGTTSVSTILIGSWQNGMSLFCLPTALKWISIGQIQRWPTCHFHIWKEEMSVIQEHLSITGLVKKNSSQKWHTKCAFSQLTRGDLERKYQGSCCQMASKTLFWCRIYNKATANWQPTCQRWLLWKTTGNAIF